MSAIDYKKVYKRNFLGTNALPDSAGHESGSSHPLLNVKVSVTQHVYAGNN